MLMFQSHFKTAWNDYFTATGQNNINSQTFSLTQTPSNTSVYVSNCLFRFVASSGNGGALSCTSVTYLLVESTSFISCSTGSQYGGAIYFSNSGGQCALYKVCGYDCCSTYTSRSDGQFVFTTVNDAISSKNYVNYTSITRCMNQISNSFHVLCLYYGKICCPSVNMSMNKCSYASGIYCQPFTDSNSYTSSLTYSSFTDNSATIAACIYLFWQGTANYEVKSCNVLRNTQGNLGTFGLFFASGNALIEDSCILENKATYIFNQYNSAYRFTILNCTLDSTSNNGYLIIRNTVTKSFIHALKHMSTQNCHSEYDAVGTLTPITPLPSLKKQIRLCTCGNSFYQSELTYLVSIIRVFVFNFIHLNAYSYPLY
jgi:hypothetical protein